MTIPRDELFHSPTVRFRFLLKFKRGPGCWEWTAGRGRKNQGVMSIGPHGKLMNASRIAWTLQYGAIPQGLWVLHKCDNSICVRPSHLFLGTPKDNTRDMYLKGRSPAKLSDDDVREIRLLSAEGYTRKQLAERFNVSPMTIKDVKRGVSFKWIV